MGFIKEIITDLEVLSAIQVRLPAGSRVTVGGYKVNQTLPLTMTITASGLSGLDTGSVQASTLYYIYLVVNSAGVRGLVASVNSNSPTGFNAYRQVGSVHTDAGSNIILAGSANDAQEDSSIGDYRESDLTEAQFQSLNGPGWILADGRNVSGSRYHQFTGKTTVPDARGVFRRGKNNGRNDGNENPDGDSALGSFQVDGFKSHNHGGGNHSHTYTRQNGTRGVSTTIGSDVANSDTVSANTGSSGTIIQTQGGSETRPKNITVNIFIRIN